MNFMVMLRLLWMFQRSGAVERARERRAAFLCEW
jgi:hypothetical protein